MACSSRCDYDARGSKLIQQLSYPKLEADVTIGWLSGAIDSLAERFSFELVRWTEPGLGDACGVAFKTGSGHIFALEALAHLQSQRGPHFEVIVEGKDVIALGVDALFDEVVAELGLSPRDILGRNEQAVEVARRLIEAAGGAPTIT